MKSLSKTVLSLAFASSLAASAMAGQGWLTSYSDAVKLSQKTGKPIMADFTGSDWCSWCIKLHKEVFDTPQFKKWADKNVILLELDYPQKPENRSKMPKQLQQQNADLLVKHQNVIKGYPTILFLRGDGTVFGKYGYDNGGPDRWTKMADRLLPLQKQPPTR